MKRGELSKPQAAKDRETSIQQILGILHKWGIHTLGQFASLHKEEINARLGREAVRMWERATGQSNRPLELVRQPESFEESFEFENEIETAEPLLFMLRRFLQQLSVRLSAFYLVAKELTLRITFTNKQHYERCFKIPQPTSDIDLLFRMLQTHLENFKSEHQIIAVSLQAHPIKPNSQQFGLFETTLRNPNQLSETLARLTALLGVDRVGTPVLEETHRPDAFYLEPFFGEVGAIDPFGFRSGQALNRPLTSVGTLHGVLRRFRAPVSTSVLLEDNQPVYLRSAAMAGEVLAQKGPYATSGNWWDETSWSREEWDLQLENNILVRCHKTGEIWEIDGVYD